LAEFELCGLAVEEERKEGKLSLGFWFCRERRERNGKMYFVLLSSEVVRLNGLGSCGPKHWSSLGS